MQTSYKKYIVWQRAHQLAVEIYRATKSFPADEKYGLTSQMRRAAFSVPCNFVEGYSRGTTKEFLHFLSIATGSLNELEYGIDFTKEIGIMSQGDYEALTKLRRATGSLLENFKKSLKIP